MWAVKFGIIARRACDYVYIDYVRRSRSSPYCLLLPINCQIYIGLHGTARRGLGGAAARPVPFRCTKCNNPPINGQCTNVVLFDVAL